MLSTRTIHNGFGLFILSALTITGLVIDTDLTTFRNHAAATLIYLAAVFFIEERRRVASKAPRFRYDLTTQILILFALTLTVQASAPQANGEAASFQKFFLLYYYLFLFAITSQSCFRLTDIQRIVLTLLLFSSFPYSETLNSDYLRSIPLLLLSMLLFYNMASTRLASASERAGVDAVTLLLTIAWFIFLTAQLTNNNYFAGTEIALRLLVAIIMLTTLRHTPNLRAPESIFILLLLFYAAQLPFICAAVFQPDASPLSFETLRQQITSPANSDLTAYLALAQPLLLTGAVHLQKNYSLHLFRGALLLLLINFILLLALNSFNAILISTLVTLALLYHLNRCKIIQLERLKKLDFKIKRNFTLAGGLLLIIFLYQLSNNPELKNSLALNLRLELWQLALHALPENLLMGIGGVAHERLVMQNLTESEVATFIHLPDLFQQLGSQLHVHNTLLQTWLEGGALYALTLLALMVYGCYSALKANGASSSLLKTGAGFALLTCILSGVVGYHLESYPIWLTLWLLLGVTLPELPPKNNLVISSTTLRYLLPAGVAITLFALFYHSGALYHKVRAEKELIGLRHRNALEQLVLQKSNELDREEMEKRTIRAIYNFREALDYYPHSSELEQSLGETRFFLYKLDRNFKWINTALIHYHNCLKRQPENPFCSIRIHRLQRIARLRGIKEVKSVDNELLDHSLQYDPFRLITHGRLFAF